MGARGAKQTVAEIRSTGIVDTDILIDAARGLPESKTFLTGAGAAKDLKISVISAMELVTGCRNRTEQRWVQ